MDEDKFDWTYFAYDADSEREFGTYEEAHAAREHYRKYAGPRGGGSIRQYWIKTLEER